MEKLLSAYNQDNTPQISTVLNSPVTNDHKCEEIQRVHSTLLWLN